MTTLDQKTVTALALVGDDRDHIFRDDDLHGFGVRVRYDQKGRLCKTWCVQYRHDGKQRRQTIGKFPRMNAATARTKAGAWLNKVHEGTDPAGERLAERKAEALKFSVAVEQYLAKQREEVRQSTFVGIEGYLTKTKYFGPLHKKPLAKVTQSDVEQCLDAIPTKPSRKMAQKTLSAFYAWAMRKGHAFENPVARCEQVKLKDRERVLTEDEIRTVWNALEDDDLGKIVKLLLLTGCRADEIGGLRWSELDLNAGTLTLPPERTKNGRTHTLPLPPLALQLIEKVEKHDGRDFVFGKWGPGFTSWAKQKQTLVAPLGLARWTIHDLRRTAATHMCELGIEPHVVEAILNHVSGHKGGIAGIYNRASYARQMKVALAMWADHVATIVGGGARKIVAFPQSA
jgi:integrase